MQPPDIRANQETFVTWRRGEAIFSNIYHIKESVNYSIKIVLETAKYFSELQRKSLCSTVLKFWLN